MAEQKLKKFTIELFKLNGLAIRSDGAKYLCGLLESISEAEHEQWIEKVIEVVQKLPVSSSVIGYDVIKEAVQELSSEASDDIDSLLQVIDIFKVPRLTYSIERRKFYLEKLYSPCLHGESNDKAALFKRRYTVVYQRTVNHDIFGKQVTGAVQKDVKKTLRKVEYLLGLTSRKEELVVLGLLTQLTDREFHVEDDTGAVKVDLSQAKFHTGLFTLNCFILVEGSFEDGVFHAAAVGLPPAEAADTTRALFGNINYFGGPGTTCHKYTKKLQLAERDASKDAMFVILSDVWLDKVKVMKKLEVMLRGYSQCPPTAFILCGNFLSKDQDSDHVQELRNGLNALADIISSYPQLMTNSRFIFVPGPKDVGPGNILPRPALPNFVVENFREKIPNSDFVSNPCRMTFCTQEIVIFREDIFTKMCRNSVFFPSDSINVASHFGRTLVCEGHLSPLPLHTVPVYWGLDHCLSLHPTPDLIITADKGSSFSTNFNSCNIVNPGSFMKTDFSFKVYFPASREIEDSQIMDDL